MCDDEGGSGAALSFAHFVSLLRRPPFGPCESEPEDLTHDEYMEAFIEAERLHRRQIIHFIAHLTRDYDNAADLAQEVFSRVYQARSSFEKAYIYRAAKHAAYDALRQTRRRRILEARWVGVRRQYTGNPQGFDVQDTRPLPDARLMESMRKEALGPAVERLPEKFRVPLMLYAGGQSYGQITGITQTREGTVKTRICRGKAILRRKLRGYL